MQSLRRSRFVLLYLAAFSMLGFLLRLLEEGGLL
jgi:hypothetical protein